ncbi:polycomb protein suz12 isoform X1 [Hydra vulgaris]|nr:polycomb protein suz12 [Hydra vulgaris]
MTSLNQKVESSLGTPRKLKFEQLRADYELFLHTYEKPTWIYRFIQRRHQLSPFMLHRNLSYFKDRRTKRPQLQQVKRKNFQLDLLLKDFKSTELNVKSESNEENHYLNISFNGFFHGPGFAEEIFETNEPKEQELFKDDFVKVEIHLCQVYHKKKKCQDSEQMDLIPLGSCKAPWNPRTQLLLPCSSVNLTVPPNAFVENGRAVKAHILSFTVIITVPKKGSSKNIKSDRTEENGLHRPLKRQKCDNSDADSETNSLTYPADVCVASFSAEMILYDRLKNCLLTDGDYELLLHENSPTIRKSNSWESKFKSKLGPFAAFSFGPTIKFNLTWGTKPIAPLAAAYKCLASPYQDNSNIKIELEMSKETKSVAVTSAEKNMRMFYRFIYNGSTRQQTEAKEGMACPWCALDCKRLYVLLKHFKTCHPRFSFVYTAIKKGHLIDVRIKENFENSLEIDGIKDIGFIDIANAPKKRNSETEIIVGRPYKHQEDLKEFTELDQLENASQMNHDRSYYHTLNNQLLPSLAHHDIKAEDDIAPEWLKEKTLEMIEEFTDLNAGEKQLMKLWNIHVLEKNYIADFTCARGCISFAEEYGKEIIQNNLIKNFMLHLNNLIDFHIIPQSVLVKSMAIIYKLKEELLPKM